MFNPSNGALRRILTPARLQELGLRPTEISNEDLLAYLTPERQRELGVRLPRASDDEHDHEPLIQFFCEPEHYGVIPEPVQAYKRIAKWFSKIPAVLDLNDPNRPAPRDHFGGPVMTAKKCLPLIDGMSLGYVLSTPADFTVRTGPAGSDLMEIINPPWGAVASTHDPIQLGSETSPTGKRPAIKFHNFWAIRTRKGWSTLFIPLMNHMDKRFTCLAAAVDTDTYPKQVNFPAVFHADNFDEVIPAGTPVVLAIPYRRSTVEREIITRPMTQEEHDVIVKMEHVQANRSHYYTQELRESGKKAAEAGCPFHQAQLAQEGNKDA